MEKKKLLLPVSIVLGCVIIGGFIYASQVKKQESIEKQQLIAIQANKEIEKNKSEMEQKKYITDRKTDCLNIYKTESDKWNNVGSWNYDNLNDSCIIVYKYLKPKSEAECDILYPFIPPKNKLNHYVPILKKSRDNILCTEGLFEKSF